MWESVTFSVPSIWQIISSDIDIGDEQRDYPVNQWYDPPSPHPW